MPIIDLVTDNSVAAGARTIRRRARHAIQTLHSDLKKISDVGNTHGTAALAAALAPDAAALASFYDDSRAVLLEHKPTATDVTARATWPA